MRSSIFSIYKPSKLELFVLFIFYYCLLCTIFNLNYVIAYIFFLPVVYCFFQKKYISNLYLLPIVLIPLLSLFLHDAKSAFFFFYSLVGLFVCSFLVKKFRFRYEFIYILFLYVFIPISISSYILGKHSDFGFKLVYIPLSENDWKINVIAWDTSIHDTMMLGFFIFIVAFYRIMKCQSKQVRDYLFLILGLYFIVFSGARGGYLSLLAILLLFYVNRNRMRKYISWFILCIFLSFVYFIDIFVVLINNLVSNPVLRLFLKLDNINSSSGITSGRFWLWNYHLDLFLSSNLRGVGKNNINFEIGDVTNTGEVAKAVTESPATFMLAAYGLLGVILLILYLYMFNYTLKKNSLFGVMLMGMAITIFCGSGINLFRYIDSFTFLFLLMYFSSVNPHFNKNW